jgi:prepilin-type N-terminal cleavage/methylation domain-containing protein
MHRLPRARRPAGFTLVELLIAAALGALLLLATAAGTGLFGAQLGQLEQDADDELHRALAGITDDVRYAWWAQVPSSRQLILADPDGDETIYEFSGDQLLVTRPGGEHGVLLDGLLSASFSAESVTRYREDDPQQRNGAFWSETAPVAGTPQATVLDAGQRLALGFTIDSGDALGLSQVPEVEGQLLQATLVSLSLPVASIAPVAAGGTLQVSLYRARSPHDARPEGAALASTTVVLGALPVATSWVQNKTTRLRMAAPGGAAWGWWKVFGALELKVSAPAATVTLDVTSLSAQLQPGRALTLVLQPSGSGVAVTSYVAASSVKSGVALDTGAGYAAAALDVPRSLSGQVTQTRTAATPVVRRLLVTLVDADGNELTGSATVLGQGLADDAWLGVIPGETDP